MAPLQLTPIKSSSSSTNQPQTEESTSTHQHHHQHHHRSRNGIIDYSDEGDSEDDDDDDQDDRDDAYERTRFNDYDDGPNNQLYRDYRGVERGTPQGNSDSSMRHGFAEAYSSEEYLTALEKSYFLYWTESRHERAGLPKPPSSNPADHKIDWRNRDRIRTAAAVLVVCLRIGYDPPDVMKTDPCAKLECWVDPHALAKDKAMERIGKNLQSQFENLAATPKTRYKQYLDPPIEDAKKFCTAARKTAKSERVLFYYNGHGVPKPTPSGELWLFNKQYTQYIPVSLSEIIAWLGSPTIFVWDCSSAGNIVTKVQEFGIKRDAELAKEAATAAAGSQAPAPDGSMPPPEPRPQIPTVPFRDTIQLGACLGHETLPMNPDLPADLFTSCLTSPIEIALRFFLLRNPLKTGELDLEMLLKVPGKVNDRRTPLGELNWIFTAVTDTIAWNTLPRDLFQKLFRHDLVVAALFRGFLLAERIMRFYECTPISVPALPQSHNHPLWDSWDLAVDMCLAQLPKLIEHERKWLESLPPQPLTMPDQPPPPQPPGPPLPYEHSNFFSEQLTAFQVWLDQGAVSKRRHPEQLPVVLQVLLSQAHRLRALILLCRFIDLGPWAVNVALSIGIFAYVLRLLQAPASELRPVLIYIWARILAVYENCKEDLLKQTYPPTRTADLSPYTYFVNILHPSTNNQLPVSNVSEHRAMCAFILAVCCRGHKPGQVACLRVNVFEACLVHLRDQDPLLRQWSALCIAQLWDDFEEAKGLGVRARVHELFCSLLQNDPIPEVRASVLYALGTLLGTSGSSDPNKKFGRSVSVSGPACQLSASEANDVELGVAMATLKSSSDGSPIVRRELVVLLSSIVNEHQGQFIIAAYRALIERATNAVATSSPLMSTALNGAGATETSSGRITEGFGTSSIASSITAAAESLAEGPASPKFHAIMFSCMYKTLFDLTADPEPDIASLASFVMDHVLELVFASPLGPSARLALRAAPSSTLAARIPPAPPAGTVMKDQLHTNEMPPRTNGHVTPGIGGTMKRATTAMKSLAHLTATALTDSPHSTPPGSLTPNTFGPSATPTPPPPSALRLNSRAGSTGGTGTNSVAASPTGSASPIAGLHSSASTDSLRYLQSRAGGKVSSKKAMPTTDAAVIEQVMNDLVAADEERARRRRAAPTLGAGEPDQVLPLKGTLFDYALEYYKESQMKTTESEEPGSVQHNERMWRRQRNEAVILKTQPMKNAASRARWDSQIGFYNNETSPNRILFHQFEPHLLAADDRGLITVYDWEKNLRINRFANGSPTSVPITSLKFVNEDDVAMLLSGTADGHVRLFRDYASPNGVELVSSFQGISETIPTTSSQQDSGLILEWQQGRGQVLMGGNVKFIRVWDATKEMAIQDLPTRANSCLTSLTGDQVAGNILAAGFGDGGMRIYDRRLSARDNMVRSYKGYHHSWLVNVHMQRGGDRELVSGSLGGEACLWDIRVSEPIQLIQAHQGGMTQLAVHEHAPVFATSSAFNVVKLWSMKDLTEPISKFGNSFGFMGQKNNSMTSMTFHPHHMMLGCAAADGHLNLFEMEDYKSALARVSEQQGPMARASWM